MSNDDKTRMIPVLARKKIVRLFKIYPDNTYMMQERAVGGAVQIDFEKMYSEGWIDETNFKMFSELKPLTKREISLPGIDNFLAQYEAYLPKKPVEKKPRKKKSE